MPDAWSCLGGQADSITSGEVEFSTTGGLSVPKEKVRPQPDNFAG